MKVIGVIFAGGGREGDFNWMIARDQYKDALFVFNDNEEQYIEHRDKPEDVTGFGCTPGGGNAIVRPYQCLTPPRSAGIPTGPNYNSLTPDVKHIIDEAIATIKRIATKEGYTCIFYSAANEGGELGTGIFRVGDDVKKYIVTELRKLEQ